MGYVKSWQALLFVLGLLLLPIGALGQTNATPANASNAVSEYLQEGGTAKVEEEERKLSVFFIIGIIINILMVAAFVVWAVTEWRKSSRKKSVRVK